MKVRMETAESGYFARRFERLTFRRHLTEGAFARLETGGENGYKDQKWRELRGLGKAVNALLREQRDGLDRL